MWVNEDGGGLETPQAMLAKGGRSGERPTTTATRNKNKFKIPDDIRESAAGVQCKETLGEERASGETLSSGKIVQKRDGEFLVGQWAGQRGQTSGRKK